MASVSRISTVQRESLRREMSLKISHDPEVKIKTKAYAEEVAAYWRDVAWPTAVGSKTGAGHPYETGRYRDSIKVEQNRTSLGRFAAGFTVITRDPNAGFIEYGTGRDKPGSRSPWGPFTETPEYAPAARTAHHFHGTSP